MNKTQREFDNRDKFIELGYNIAYYRKHAGLTQEQLAERVGISRQHLGAIEAPNLVRPISLELLFNIADVLDIPAYKLLRFRDEELNYLRGLLRFTVALDFAFRLTSRQRSPAAVTYGSWTLYYATYG